MIRTMTALLGASLMLTTVASADVVKHANTPPGLILQGVTVTPGTEMLYLSGQLASPIDPAKPM